MFDDMLFLWFIVGVVSRCKTRANESRDKFYLAMPSAAEFRAAKLVQTRAEAKFIWIMPSAAEVRKIFLQR